MRRDRGVPLDGWFVLDKPGGITSTTALGRVRHAFGARKAGHGGTLDPIATGVLPIAFGAATRTVPFVMDGAKTYRFTVRFGERRSTDDREGEVLEASAARPTDAALRAALPALTGDILQVPPAFSALKVAGRRAYDLAREGRPPALPPRPARIDRFALVDRPDADHAVFEVTSGKGVYMRSLARDVAAAAGALGHIDVLRRLRAGPFDLADAISLDILLARAQDAHASPDLLRPIATVLADIPALAVDHEEAARLSNGAALHVPDLERRIPGTPANLEQGLVRAMAGGRVIGLCRVDGAWVRPARILQPL